MFCTKIKLQILSPFAKQLVRATKLGHLAIGKDKDAIAVHDGVETVGNGEHCAVSELLPDLLLDECVGARIHVGSRFIKHQNSIPSQHCTGQAKELPLPHRQVGTWEIQMREISYGEKLQPPSLISVASPSFKSLTASAR